MDSDYYCLREPAKQIRLMNLLSPTPSGDLRGRVQRFDIESAPEFISVSHVWGDKKADRPITIESGCCDKQLQISQNLESLLVCLICHTSETLPQIWQGGSRLPMWIDMVCIDQKDTREKALQVQLMREIYSQSSAVIVWIHESNPYLKYAFLYLRRLMKQSPKEKSLFDPMGWDSIRRLLACDWFQRRWVVQECILPKDAIFLWGSDCIAIDELFQGVEVAVNMMLAQPKHTKELNPGTPREITAIRMLKKGREQYKEDERPPVSWWLEHFISTRTTLAHDRVYAFSGLCDEFEMQYLSVRYDLEPEEIYHRVTRLVISSDDLEFLSLCAPAQRDVISSETSGEPVLRPYKGPSWVPNYYSPNMRRCLAPSDIDKQIEFFDASMGIYGTPSVVGETMGTLRVHGVFIGRIQSIADFSPRGRKAELSNPDSRLVEQYFDFWMKPTDNPAPYPSAQCCADTFMRTLSLLGIYLDPVPSPDDIPDMFLRWAGDSDNVPLKFLRTIFCYDRRKKNRELGENKFVSMELLEYFDAFLTDEGYMGLAREGAGVGDEIWLIGWCSTPILLSPKTDALKGPKSNEPGRYEVKGEVFLDGFMFADGVDKAQRDSDAQVIHLV